MRIDMVWSPVGKFTYKIAKKEIFNNEVFLGELKKFCFESDLDFDKSLLRCEGYFDGISSRHPYNKSFWSLIEFLVRKKIIGDLSRLKYNAKNLKKLKELAKENILIILPNHKSVFDFMILPYVLATESAILPSILAADVFDIFFIGTFFRKIGAYFVKREEKDPLYFITFKYYLGLLLKYQIVNMFFIEGGRNKKGDYSTPRVGVLKYILEGKRRDNIEKDILFVPVSLSYEFVPEQGVVVSEHVSQKRKHISKSLLKYLSVGKKFENCYIHFNEPIRLSELSEKYKEDRLLLSSLADEVMEKIKGSIIVSNTALICYTLDKLGKGSLGFEDFKKHVKENYDFLKSEGRDVRYVDLEKLEDHLKRMQLKNIVKVKENQIIVPENSKNLIQYYSNNILHFFNAQSGQEL